MNKIKIQLMFAAAVFLISCSSSYTFKEKEMELYLDGVGAEVSNDNILRLQEYIYVIYESSGNIEETSISDLASVFGYLRDFFWIVDGDTIRSYEVKKEVEYGRHFFKLFLKDIWGDTLSYSDSIDIHESLGISLLSPVNDSRFCFSKGYNVKFQYKVNGASKEEAECFVYICKEEECEEEDSWEKLEGDSFTLNESIYWQVKAQTEQENAASEIRKICLKE